MKKNQIIILSILILGMFISCELAQSDSNTSIEDAIMRVIAADDSTYGFEGMGDIEDEDYGLGKSIRGDHPSDLVPIMSVIDSNYVWRFGRRGMEVERVVTVEVEDDTSALALIVHNVTGAFHVSQFARIWTGEGTWERGDSIQFSVKPIVMTSTRHVVFKKRFTAAGEELWQPVSMTLLSGHSGEVLDIEAVEWIAEDSVLVLTNFETVFYDRNNPLLLSQSGTNHMNVILSNDVEGAGEQVTCRLGYHPRLSRPDARSWFYFQYTETLDTGDKVYTQRIYPTRRHGRHLRGFVEVIDFRTLFDHDYGTYTAATLGFVYTNRDRIRP